MTSHKNWTVCLLNPGHGSLGKASQQLPFSASLISWAQSMPILYQLLQWYNITTLSTTSTSCWPPYKYTYHYRTWRYWPMVHTKVMNTSQFTYRININGTTYLKHIESLIHYKTRSAELCIILCKCVYITSTKIWINDEHYTPTHWNPSLLTLRYSFLTVCVGALHINSLISSSNRLSKHISHFLGMFRLTVIEHCHVAI